MIVRTWEGRAREGCAEAYLAHLTSEIVPEIRALPGCRGAQILRGLGGRSDNFQVMTFWSSLASIEAFAGADVEHAVVPPEARALLAEFDERARHFEVAMEIRQDP